MGQYEPSALARLPLILLQGADDFGLDREELMRDAGLSQSDLDEPDSRVSLRRVWALWRIATEKAGDPWLMLRVVASTRVRAYGLVGYTMTNSRTLRQALQRLARYSRIVTEAVRLRFNPEVDGARMVVDGPATDYDVPSSGPAVRHAFLLAAARELTGQQDLTPLEVRFPHPPPPDAGELGRMLRAPLVFDAPDASVAYSQAQIDLSVVGADVTLGGYLDQLATDLLRGLPDPDSFRDRVRRAMWSELSDGPPSLTTTAANLAVSPRTLQRRLREEGTSFGQLLDELRREFALRLLRDRKLAVYEVAFLLGYAEPSTFHRAFRRWTGLSPLRFRRNEA